MKSSMTTTSAPGGLSLGPSAAFPLVMRTRLTRSPALKKTPRKERVWLPGREAGTAKVPRDTPAWSKYWIVVEVADSTSVKTEPKPLTKACDVVPGRKKTMSTTLLPIAVKSRSGEKVWNSLGYPALMFPNRTGVRVGLPVLALAWKPLPGVEKTTPRGEFELKKLAGRLLGEEKESGTPSQLISRRPEAKVPPTPLLAPPRSARNRSTAA